MFGGTARPIASQMGLAGTIELAGGLLVMVGLFAGLAAFIASGQMAFAYFLAHAPRGGWPVENDGELAVLFCFVLLFISARGAGIWSLDEALFQRRSRRDSSTAKGLSPA
jgi:putative oxidoreductase